MRSLRPENYSDTTERTSYLLDAAVFNHHLDTITSRNQTHDFEIFCRKLCERAICPNLRPQTGPDGGGDSKADSETLPVSDELMALIYVGEPNAGHEKWAFAFSAKEKWQSKARSDVDGIAKTERGYKRVIFITSRYAKAKTRSALEDELTKKYGIEVTIHDRSWIMQQVIEFDRKDLAYNYLHVGQEISDTNQLGPADYSRNRQLEAIEKSFLSPDSFAGMERQGVTEALLAAKLSRSLERPRPETDGRFQRAIRLGDAHGTYRQKLEARYEALWTAVWWFDDYRELNANYDAFEALAIDSDHAINLEFLSNLLQMLYNAVIYGYFTRERCALEARVARLKTRLEAVAADGGRPNNALWARTLLLIGNLNAAALAGNRDAIPPIWSEFSEILAQARGLGEFDATRLVELIEAVGNAAGNDPTYNALIEEAADFISERTGEAEGALVLLKRAKKLDFDSHFEMIRLLGKAARKLAKKEYAEKLIEALQLLSLAYRSAGLLWASRATCIFAAASIVIEGETESQLDVSIVPTLELMGWTTLQLRHLPDFLEAIQLLNGCLKALPLDEESQERLKDRLMTFDMALGSYVLNFQPEELRQVDSLPDVLEALGLFTARFALLYALGYGDQLRTDGSIPPEESDEAVRTMVKRLASQPVTDDIRGPLITNLPERKCLQSTVMGMTVEVMFEGTTTATLVAEAVLASIEVCFATAFELRIHPHTERYEIALVEDARATLPSFKIDPLELTAKLTWPKDLLLTSFERSADTIRFLIEASVLTMAASCVWHDGEKLIERLARDEAVFDRITTISHTANSYHRLFSRYLASIDGWKNLVGTTYALRDDRPTIVREKIAISDAVDAQTEPKMETWWKSGNHRDIQIRSVIDYNLWNRAGWKGTLYASYGPSAPPIVGLLFADRGAARAIFERWRERFGTADRKDEIYLSIVRDVSDANPAHYNVLITSGLNPAEELKHGGAMVLSRFNRMHPDTDTNLRRFLIDYEKAGAYILMPAVIEGGEPQLLSDIAILKRNLVVKSARDVGPKDVEQCCLGQQADEHFAS
ncbi:MAG: tetratricopeptide repeat protein [Alphaproteobacteria bacterium]|nr:tetratricopeptide repeat protein [Alphaproteobacteria bacterium]